MIHYKPFPTFDITRANNASWNVYLDGKLIIAKSADPMIDCGLWAWKQGYTGIYRVRRPLSGRAYDWQALIAAVAGDNLGTGIDSPAYGKPRQKPQKAVAA